MTWFAELLAFVVSATGADAAELRIEDAGEVEHHVVGQATDYTPPAEVEAGSLGPDANIADWISSAMVVPVVSPSAETGWLLIAAADKDRFDDASAGLLHQAVTLCETHLDGQIRSTELITLSAELHRSQVDLKHAKDQLEVSNQELEQFAYIAAHELVAPLRSVAVFAEVLATLAEQNADTNLELANCVVEIRSGVKTMTEQVQYLLTLSRANQLIGELELVETTRVALEAADTLGDMIDDVDGEVTVDDLPSVRAHAVPLQSVFANLITNAARYRHPERPVRIHVSGRSDMDTIVIEVADNSSGISDEAKTRIFGLFERNSTDNDGLGVGLAVSRRILEGFGARISVESSEKGSTFSLHFPATGT